MLIAFSPLDIIDRSRTEVFSGEHSLIAIAVSETIKEKMEKFKSTHKNPITQVDVRGQAEV